MPSVSEVESAIAEIVALIVPEVDPGTVHGRQRFREDLDVGSLGMVELVIGLEQRFSLPLPDAELKRLTTVADLAEYVAGAGA